MRVFKILLILIGLFCFGGLSVIIYILLTSENVDSTLFVNICLGLVYVASILNLAYHVKSFQFYKKKENVNINQKLSVLLWIGAIVFHSFLLLLFGYALYDYLRFLSYGLAHQLKDVMLLVFMFVACVLGFLELSLLQKRIKTLKSERHTKDEINEIGNHTL